MLLIEDERSIRELVSSSCAGPATTAERWAMAEKASSSCSSPLDAIVRPDGCPRGRHVTKPSGVLELTARIAALTRRVHRAQAQSATPVRRAVSARDVELDPVRHTVRVRGRDAAVTPHEFELLYQLASQPGVVLSRKELLTSVWRGQAFVTDRSIDTLVRHLRCKVEVDPAAPQLIVTVWGYGYKFIDS